MVLLYEWYVITSMNEMLSDTSKFRNADRKSGKEINYMLKLKDRLISFLRTVEKSLSTDLYKNVYPNGSQHVAKYGLAKIHKPLVNNFRKFRPIL